MPNWMLPALLGASLAAAPAMADPKTPPPPPPGGTITTCTDVDVGSAHGYDCLNAQLSNMVQGEQRPSSATDAPVSATSPSNVVGSFNEGATRNRLGANFGKSVIPSRPPPPVFQPPLTPPRK